MKLKSWVVWLLVVVFLAAKSFFSRPIAKKARRSFLCAKPGSRRRICKPNWIKSKIPTPVRKAQRVARLRAENQELPRLRNQVTQLQTANQKLTQQLNSTLTAAQQQQAQLQQLAEENQQARTIVQQVDAEAARNTCINHLRQIDQAKQSWALENNKAADAIPMVQDISPYFKDGVLVCPSGGVYTIGAVGELPICSIPGHALLQ